ncbi:CYTH and CHAD domain-containing protein [Psychrobacter sp. NZS113]|uniref:CYTH and CHAD domain-containing protein n=1 Tax=Psychrobacter sp. NZS113 TaxID=2792045 RepID=UPI0018CDA777|nr:CYTH and CHAD domain-containing protein [Psychrobacter sp. NZS113]MBH0096895.1 CYTH and CHAD domain-containing protein [Psychrobacter sp. NZS113]
MQEIELKFLVPEPRLKGLMRQAQVKSSQLTQLAAHYYDTPDQQLAQAGIGLRIRKEGDSWVQTIKAGGDGIAARLEHNAVLDNEQVQAMLDTNTLMPDLTIYKDTPIAPALSDFKLKKLAKKLTRLYVTDVQRTTRLLVEDSSDQTENSIEIAYDHGEIIHGNDDAQREVIQEIEFELISGDLDFLFMTAKTWCQRYKLCLSTVTKAERGGLLINGQNHSPAVSADLSQLNINKKVSIPAFIRAAVHNCLLQILPNSSAIVAGSTDSSHILQLQIGIRRLCAALNAFASFSDEINPDWQPILNQTAILLGDYQELDYLANYIEPKLQEYGAPKTNWTTDIDALKIKPIDAISVPDFQLTLLELIAFTMSNPSLEPQNNKPAIDKIVKILSKQYENLLQTHEVFGEEDNVESDSMDLEDVDLESTYSNLDTDDQADFELHHLTDLRYITEFCAPLLSKKGSKKRTERQLKYLIKAQKSLDKHHSYAQYQQRYQIKSAVDNNALYGAGWFAALLKKDTKRSDKCLAKVRDRSIFW